MTTDGARAEEQAARFLAGRGLKILARNYRGRGGEIDLVCRDGATLVFVEVRLRTNRDFGGAAASIGPTKQRRLILAARHWLQRHGESPCRFDAVLVEGAEGRIEWLRGVFSAD